MLFTKSVDGLRYKPTGVKKPSDGSAMHLAVSVASELSTSSLIWLLTIRHKVTLLVVCSIGLGVSWWLC